MRAMMTLSMPAVAAVLGLSWNPAKPAAPAAVEFPHAKHLVLMDCTMCHSGVASGNMYPDPTFCGACHNGSVQPEVDWSPPAPRPQSNLRFDHGTHIGAADNACTDCHVEAGSSGNVVHLAVVEQCRDCHSNSPALKTTSAWHGDAWVAQHQLQAAAAPESCANCHVRADCLECHRPGAATGSPAYHPADFLSGHSTWAYSRAVTCGDCHNTSAFCVDCHQSAGLTSKDGIGGNRFHDAMQNFTSNHAQAARQSLETCVACHTQNDCLGCHAATGPGRFSPHGPGFDADRLRDKNPSMCAICHGTNIPGGG